MKNKTMPLVGAHVSIAGSFTKAIDEGIEIGCTAIQIFTKSNRQWHAKKIDMQEARDFIEKQKKSPIQVVVAHASYLINLGSASHDVQKKSFSALVDEIKRCDQLNIPYLVLHPGTAEPSDKQATLEKTGRYINEALQQTPESKTAVLVETMAGQGKSVGSSFQELAAILDQVTDKKRIGVCFDTCHVFVAGQDFSTEESYKQLFKNFDDVIGLTFLKVFHVNNSKKELGSKVDRHENINDGQIPTEAFKMIMQDKRFELVPKILETPKSDDLESDKKNLKTLIKLSQ